jgi:lysozyme
MSHRDIVRAQLIVDEGRVPHAYQDSEGYWTIGVGRLIDKRLGGGLSWDEIDYLLDNDIIKAERTAATLFPSFESLSMVRRAVLVNMAHNLGQERLAGFKNFRHCVEAQNFEAAAAEMLESRWAGQTGQRAVRLAKQMRDG